MKINKKILIYCILFGIVLTILSGFIKIGCNMSDTGGIGEGFSGLPFPIISCGAWGNSIERIQRYFDHKDAGGIDYLPEIIIGSIIDIIFWSFISYLFYWIYKKIKSKQK